MATVSDGATADLAATFKLLSDETRLRVLQLLLQAEELNVRSLCDYLAQSQPAVSHHLALLKSNGIIRIRREGKHNFYRLVPEKLDTMLRSACQRLLTQEGSSPSLVRRPLP